MTTGGAEGDAATSADGADAPNASGMASARVVPSGNDPTISQSSVSIINQGTSAAHSQVAKQINALCASRTSAANAESRSRFAASTDWRRRA
jgi:hypothetical protein